MLYAIHTLLGVKVYSLVLFFGCVQCVLFFGASYCLLRELFRWRFTPILVLVGFILLEANNTLTGISDSLTGLSHLQYTLPLEFALAPQMICVLYLIRYLRYGEKKVEKGKFAGCIAGDELLVFVLALAAMLASHFHAAIMAFCLCLIVSVFYLKRIFSRERFLPLVLAVLCGASIALAPMVAGFVSGIPMQASMNWALGIISGEPNVDRPDHQLEELEELNETLSGNEGGAYGLCGQGVPPRRLRGFGPRLGRVVANPGCCDYSWKCGAGVGNAAPALPAMLDSSGRAGPAVAGKLFSSGRTCVYNDLYIHPALRGTSGIGGGNAAALNNADALLCGGGDSIGSPLCAPLAAAEGSGIECPFRARPDFVLHLDCNG